jgi:glutathione S-transferase
MLKLYADGHSASVAPRILLEELGVAHEIVTVDRASGEHKSAAYLALNPNGLVPTLVDGDLVLWETAAILLHLCDREGRFAPALGTPARAEFYKWLIHLTNTIQPAYIQYYYAARYVEGDPASFKALTERRLIEAFARIEAEIEGPYLLGETYTAADILLVMLVSWGTEMATPPGSLPKIGALCRRVLERPAVHSVFAEEVGPEPWI